MKYWMIIMQIAQIETRLNWWKYFNWTTPKKKKKGFATKQQNYLQVLPEDMMEKRNSIKIISEIAYNLVVASNFFD